MAHAETVTHSLGHAELVAQLSASVGETKANELITTTASQLGIVGHYSYSKEQALMIFETLAASPGLIGIVARCAKARLFLKLNK